MRRWKRNSNGPVTSTNFMPARTSKKVEILSQGTRRNEMTGEGTPHKKIVSRYHSKN